MRLEFDMLVLRLDSNAQPTLEAKGKEGWITVPGTTPLVVYNLCRPTVDQPMADMKGTASLKIDESKIYIIDKDGNRVERH